MVVGVGMALAGDRAVTYERVSADAAAAAAAV